MLDGVTPTPTTPSAILAGNIAAARARRHLQQQDLAERMRALGWKWVRQTVGEVENNRRRLTAEEILGLAISLETTIQRLLTPLDEDKWVQVPSGLHLDINFVAQLVAGANTGYIQWHGNLPYAPIPNQPDPTPGADGRMPYAFGYGPEDQGKSSAPGAAAESRDDHGT